MSFEIYINKVLVVINNMINLSRNVLNDLLENNIFKSILYILILYLIFESAQGVIGLIKNVISSRKGKEKNKPKNEIE